VSIASRYDTLDELREHTPPQLADAVAQTLNGTGDTLLDI